MTVVLTDLPPELIFRILENLLSRDIGQLSQTCTQLRAICSTDIVWQKLCQQVCDINADDWEASYYDIYTKVLQKYGRCLGLWRRNMRPYGGLLQVKVDHGRLLATEYKPPYVTDIHGPLRPKNVFSIGINKSTNQAEVLCLHGYGVPHPGSVEFDRSEESEVVFKCCQMSSHAHPEGSSVELDNMIKEETNNHNVPFTNYDQARLKCYISNVQKYLLTHIEVQPPNPVYPIQPGLFLAHYSAHGIEMFLLRYDMSMKEAQVIKITGDPNVPAGETSIYINLRKPMQLTEEQQLDISSLMEISEDEVPDAEDIQPLKQPFVIPPSFSTFMGDFKASTCQYRYFSKGRVAGTGYTNPSFSPGHFCILSEDVIYNLWSMMYCIFGYYRVKDFI